MRQTNAQRHLIIVTAILVLVILILACNSDLPGKNKRYHIRIDKTWVYCDSYSWLSDDELELVGCLGYAGTVTKKMEAGTTVLIREYTCTQWERDVSCPFQEREITR